MRKLQLGHVYPITGSGNPQGLNHVQLAREFLRSGVRFFQVREKNLPDADLYRQLLEIRRLCNDAGAQLVVNDRVDLALATGADGVHLGQTDLPVETARELLGPQAIIGLSTHDRDQFREAQLRNIDYVAIGPVFATSTKRSAYEPLDLDVIRKLAHESRYPVVAIGGITLETAPLLWEAGAETVAVVSDVVGNADPAGRLLSYLAAARERSGNARC